MYKSHIITISDTGNIIIPKAIRKHIDTDTITFEIDNDGKVILSPFENIGGVFANNDEREEKQ